MHTPPNKPSLLAWSAATALLYPAVGRLAMLLAIPPGYATPVFPSSGLALALVVLFGVRLAPAVFVGSFLLNLWLAMAPAQGAPPPLTLAGLVAAVGIAIGAMLQALAGRSLVRRLLGDRLTLSSEGDIAKFLVAAGPVACLVNAGLGPLVLVACGLMPSAAVLPNVATWWVGDALGVIVFAPAVLVLLGAPRELWRRRRASVGVPLVASFALVTVAFVHLRSTQNEAALSDFRGRAEDTVAAMYKTLEGYREAIMSVERHFVLAHDVTEAEFARLVERSLARNGDLQSLVYAPRVADDALESFAAAASAAHGRPYAVFETDAWGARSPARARPAHFPILFIEPSASNAAALGFDLASEPMRGAAIGASIALRDMRATLVPHLVQDPLRRPGLLVVEPVIGADDEPLGLACAAFRVDAMLASAVASSHLGDAQIALFAGDTLPDAEPIVVLDGKTRAVVPALARQERGGEDYEARVAFGGQALRVIVRAESVPMPASASSSVWTFMVLGLLFTALLTAFLLAITGRGEATRRLIAERTAALEASRTRLAAVTESAYDGIIVADQAGNIASWNAAAERMFGHAAEHALGRSLSLIIPERFRAAHAAGLRRAVEARSARLVGQAIDLRAVHADGHEIDVELSMTLWDAGDGLYFTAVVRDVTARKQAEAAASETRRMLDIFYDSIPSMVGVTDVVGETLRPVALNRAMAAFLGCDKNDIAAAVASTAAMPSETRAEWLRHFAAATTTNVPYTFEMVRDGGAKVLSATICRLGDAPGGGARFCYSVSDLSGQKRAERALYLANQSLEARVDARTAELGHALGRLRESETRIRQLADSMPHIVWTARPDGATNYFNERWYQFLGLTSGEAQGIGLAPLMPAEDAAQFMALWAEAVASGEEMAAEYRLFDRASGEHRWHLGRVLPLRDYTGEISRWVGTSTDIHEQKEVLRHHLEGQKKLAQSAADFRFLAETIPQLVWTADGSGKLDFLNRRWVEFTGKDLAASVRSDELLLPEDRLRVSMAWSRSVQTRDPFDMEYRLRRADGEYRWQLARAMPLVDANGATRWFGTATDIHDQKLKEQELDAARMALELAQETAQVAAWDFDVARAVLTRTLAHDRFYGYAALEPWTLARVLDRVHPEDRARVAQAMAASRDGTGDAYALEYRVVWPDGSVHWLSFMARFIRDERGVVTHHRGTVHDVTALQTMKEHQQQLAVREQAAIESSRLKSEFLASMSHEIRTPINGVLGMTRLLLETPLTEEQRDFGDAIKRSGDALLTVINDILDFSKIEAGKLDFDRIDFQLAQTVEDARSTIAYAAQKRGLTFISELADDLPQTVQGDPGRLRQVVTNLLSNAVKFTMQGAVTLRAFAVSSDDHEHVVRFEIKDTGIGIAREAGERLFKAFSQADGSTTRRFGGTGLGLSICKALVERMAGEIGFESEEGRGSTFWFTVRLGRGADVAAAAAPVAPVPTQLLRRKARILVAEDIQINQVIAIKMLERLGYAAHAVANGREALHALHSSSYDLVLMDCHMPEMDGYEATTAIRASKSLSNPRVPIIAMTANAMKGDREKCLAVGMSDYVAKPVEPNALASVLRKWLETPATATTEPTEGGEVSCDPSASAA